MEKLNKLLKDEKWNEFFSAALQALESAKVEKDQSKIDLVFRLMRGAVFMLGHKFGESVSEKETDPFELSCSACGTSKDKVKLVGFSTGCLCQRCAKLIVEKLENA